MSAEKEFEEWWLYSDEIPNGLVPRRESDKFPAERGYLAAYRKQEERVIRLIEAIEKHRDTPIVTEAITIDSMISSHFERDAELYAALDAEK